MMIRGSKYKQFFFFFAIICLWFISCKSTNTNVSETDNTIQQELDELALEQDEEVGIVVEVTESEVVDSESIIAEEVEELVEEPQPELSVEEQRALKMATLTREQKLFYGIKYTYDYDEVGEDLDYKIMVDHEAKKVIIQFEETDSDQDWHNNYLIFPWPLKLDNKVIWTTYGYAKIYKSAKNIPIDRYCALLEQYPDYQAVILGWSLGSAMAKIIARHYIIRSPKGTQIDDLTTYGDVKCWFNPFYSLKNKCVRIREYVNSNDMITWCMPFCRRDVKCRVGDRFNFSKLKNSEFYHTHYEDCDFSKWGDVSPDGEPISQK